MSFAKRATMGISKRNLTHVNITLDKFKEAQGNTDEALGVIKNQLSRFENLIEFGQIINSPTDYRSMHKQAVNKMCDLLRCEKAFLYRFDSKKNELYYDIHKDKNLYRVRISVDETTFVGACAKYKAILHITDTTNDLRYQREKEALGGIEARNMLLAPLMSKGEFMGVIEAVNSVGEGFDENDIHFVEAVANQLSVAVENINLFEAFRNQFLQVSMAFAHSIGIKDKYTGGHTKRVAHWALLIGRELGLSAVETNDLKFAAILHDIGKIGISDAIIRKETQLTEEEYEIMKQHPKLAEDILGEVEGLTNVLDGIRYHHERWDGKGYPYGLAGEKIPVLASIIAVADTFDAMASTRAYRKAMPAMDAYSEILTKGGTQFDPKVVDAFDKAFRKTSMFVAAQVAQVKKAA
jgi:HD-GYP domain-containing protein (c-di-GMP phosphodiesterase class II)